MSGTGAGHNKFHTCYGCPDRTVEPSCHTEKAEAIKREKRNGKKKALKEPCDPKKNHT